MFCTQYANVLRAGRTPHTALCKGWVFNDAIPQQLSVLTHHESLLVALRLPCIYTWRSQCGFGQIASRGPPVSFSNPVAQLLTALPRKPSVILSVPLDRGLQINVDVSRVRAALTWLIAHNPLYASVSLDEDAFDDIAAVGTEDEVILGSSQGPQLEATVSGAPNDKEICEAVAEEAARGAQGPLDGEALFLLQHYQVDGTEDLDNTAFCTMLIQHMLRPFRHGRKDMIPSYHAEKYLESYFPTLFPYGRGGPKSMGTALGVWVKHALQVYKSRFASDVNFIFFVHAALRRKRLTGLALHAPLRRVSTNAIIDVKKLLDDDATDFQISNRIDKLLRSGTLNASFETLRGTPAFWSTLQRESWAYLVRFGPCQLFVTISVADIIDPYIYMEIGQPVDSSLTFDEARNLSTKQRADLLAKHPVAANTLFHRRVQSFFDNFLFGHTRPFGNIRAFLGRIEQQARKSPHFHIFLWLEKTAPVISKDPDIHATAVANFIELFCTATLPPDTLTNQSDITEPTHRMSPPLYSSLQPSPVQPYVSVSQKHAALSMPYRPDAFDGSTGRQRDLRDQFLATQAHRCQSYCLRRGKRCRFFSLSLFNPEPASQREAENPVIPELWPSPPAANHLLIPRTLCWYKCSVLTPMLPLLLATASQNSCTSAATV